MGDVGKLTAHALAGSDATACSYIIDSNIQHNFGSIKIQD
jgi:hypothetical protein